MAPVCTARAADVADVLKSVRWFGRQDVKDNHEEAAKVAPQTLRLCQMVSCVYRLALLDLSNALSVAKSV